MNKFFRSYIKWTFFQEDVNCEDWLKRSIMPDYTNSYQGKFITTVVKLQENSKNFNEQIIPVYMNNLSAEKCDSLPNFLFEVNLNLRLKLSKNIKEKQKQKVQGRHI